VAEERVCKACGKKFTPMAYTGRGSTSRMYCYDPACERRRESEVRRRHRSRKRLKKAIEKRKEAVEKRIEAAKEEE